MHCFSSKHRKHVEKGWDVNLLAQAASGIIMSSTILYMGIGLALYHGYDASEVKAVERDREKRQGSSLPSSCDNYLCNQC